MSVGLVVAVVPAPAVPVNLSSSRWKLYVGSATVTVNGVEPLTLDASGIQAVGTSGDAPCTQVRRCSCPFDTCSRTSTHTGLAVPVIRYSTYGSAPTVPGVEIPE